MTASKQPPKPAEKRAKSTSATSSATTTFEQSREFERWLLELTSLPTAAARESRVIAWIERWVKARAKSVELSHDEFGNLLLHRAPRETKRSPVYITAHLDHPAFVVRRVAGRDVELEFRGGVHDPYFEKAKIEIFEHNERDGKDASHTATITKLDATAKPFKIVTARLTNETTTICAGDIARWKLPAPKIEKGILHTHACDDLAAVAAALCAFERIREMPACGHVGLLFTRSEEIGFIGAIGAARSRSVPKDARLICLENSRSFPESPIGAGPIVRVGDRITVFSPDLTNRIAAIMGEYQKTAPTFQWQRKLMPGGACEASAFSCYGYSSTCLCLPLGNYHNMEDIDGVLAGKRPAKVGSEFIAISDFHGLITMLEIVARDLDSASVPPLKDRMESLWREHGGLLAR
ncbi:MAG: hypothetical protein SGJ09_03325 [Phycisphaerae bacterium]|nr:hypothetical protein [Phycisphaerae bacterium]